MNEAVAVGILRYNPLSHLKRTDNFLSEECPVDGLLSSCEHTYRDLGKRAVETLTDKAALCIENPAQAFFIRGALNLVHCTGKDPRMTLEYREFFFLFQLYDQHCDEPLA